MVVLLSALSCTNKNDLPDPLEAGWQGEAVCKVLEENTNVRVLKCTFKPGVGHEKHYHNPHYGYTLAGGQFKITDSTGTRDVNVPTRYSFSKDSVTVHEVLNIGETTAVFLIVEYN
ncbi:MAG: cupin domain-containing protein [Winogradskyella sp.]